MKGVVKRAEPETEWFEISDDYWLDPGEIRPKLRLLVDHNVSIDVVQECRRAKVDVKTAAELGVQRLDDEALYNYCRSVGLALLTGDEDFWSKSQYGPEKGGYVIVAQVPTSRRQEFLRAFGLFFGTFGRTFGGRLSKGLRVLAKPQSFFAEMVGLAGSRVRYELMLYRPRLWAREIRDATLPLAKKLPQNNQMQRTAPGQSERRR